MKTSLFSLRSLVLLGATLSLLGCAADSTAPDDASEAGEEGGEGEALGTTEQAASACRIQVLDHDVIVSGGTDQTVQHFYKVKNACNRARKIAVVIKFCPDGPTSTVRANGVATVSGSELKSLPCIDEGPKYR